MIPLSHYVILSGVLFAVGVYGVLVRRSAIGVLIAIELLLNAAALNFVAFSRSFPGDLTGQVVALFVIALEAAAAAVGLILVLSVYRQWRRNVTTDVISAMKG